MFIPQIINVKLQLETTLKKFFDEWMKIKITTEKTKAFLRYAHGLHSAKMYEEFNEVWNHFHNEQ